MVKDLSSVSRNKSSVFLLVLALIVGGISAQATGLLNSPTGGYLICVNPKTQVVTHPSISKCPKGYEKLILGVQGEPGSTGITGAAGIAGKDGSNGKDGKTLWNGVKDPESTWGAPGDMFINATTKVLFGPKNLDGSWPAGVAMVGAQGATGLTGATGVAGPSGPQGPGGSGSAGATGAAGAAGAAGTAGTNATIAITESFECDGTDAGTVADEKCKIGMTGPGGGLIFFVDYNDQYAGFNYLEAGPADLSPSQAWSNNSTVSVSGATGWAARAVGRGQTNTTAILTAYPTSGAAVSAGSYVSPTFNGGTKDDWFLGSLGEMKLMFDNLQGLGGFVVTSYYWSSTEKNSTNGELFSVLEGALSYAAKTNTAVVRPVRAF